MTNAIDKAITEFEILSSFPQYSFDYVDLIKELRGCKKALEQPAQDNITIKNQIHDAFNEGFEKGKKMSLAGSIPMRLINLERVATENKEALEQPTVAELNDEYLRDTYVEGQK